MQFYSNLLPDSQLLLTSTEQLTPLPPIPFEHEHFKIKCSSYRGCLEIPFLTHLCCKPVLHHLKDLKSSFPPAPGAANHQREATKQHPQPVVLTGAQQDNIALSFLLYFLVTCNRKKLNLSFPSSCPLAV